MKAQDLHRLLTAFRISTANFTLVSLLFFCCTMIQIAEADFKGSMFFMECMDTYATKEENLDCASWVDAGIPEAGGRGACYVDAVGEPEGGSENPCDSKPCKNNGVCIVNENSKENVLCLCKGPMTGDFCDRLKCGDFPNCYRDSDLVVYVDMSTPMNWEDANKFCTDKGMQMFMDKNWTLHGFVYGALNSLVTDRDKKVAFWMGLSRENSGSPFKFVDGTSPDDYYYNWANGFPLSDGRYVELANTEDYQFKWVNVDCTSSLPCTDGFDAYPICEKRYPDLKW